MVSSRIRKVLLTPTLFGSGVIVSSFMGGAASASEAPTVNTASSPALEQISAYQAEEMTEAADQVTSVSQLTDVKPTDWAFQALQSLVERYGCIVGYPDRTFRGNKALSRYEFAAGLNACMDRISELIAAGTADLVKKEDLLAVQRLQEEFAAELAALRGRVDALEVRTTTLERQQFSATTKLRGEAIFALSDTWGDSATVNGGGTPIPRTTENDNTEPILSDRVRLSFDTSFTGKDTLRTRLQARNTTPFSGIYTGTNMTRLSFDGNEGNAVGVDKLYYRFPLGNNLRIQIDAINDEVYDGLVSSLSSPFDSSGQGSISRFGRFNPVYRANNPGTSGSAGITFDYKLATNLNIQGGYLAGTCSNVPSEKCGLFDGGSAAVGQVVFRPGNFTLGLTYFYSYYPGTQVNLTGSTGTSLAIRPFAANATSANTLGAEAQYRFSPSFLIGGWYGISWAEQQSGGNNNATIQNWAAYAGFPDLFWKGNLLGLLVGMPPKVTSNSIDGREDQDTPIHLEGFYRFKVSDNISITPGAFVIFNPEGNSDNATQIIGTLRTTFSF
ncbi:MAG: iron uptake porin [Leptolyngbyaceae cyanobacterium]